MARTTTTSTQDTVRPQDDGVTATPDWLTAPPHTLEAEPIIKAFKSNARLGLSEQQVAEHREVFGLNKLKETPPPTIWGILLRNTLNGKRAPAETVDHTNRTDEKASVRIRRRSLLTALPKSASRWQLVR